MTRELRPFERMCGYGCDKPWRPVFGTKLLGHARCALTPEVEAKLDELEARRNPMLNQKQRAAELGVTIGVLRAWEKFRQRRSR